MTEFILLIPITEIKESKAIGVEMFMNGKVAPLLINTVVRDPC